MQLKKRVSFYIAQYPVRWTAQNALHFTPWQTCSFRHQLGFSGTHSAMLQLLCKYYSLTFPPLSIARYSFIQLRQLGRHGENKNALDFEAVAKGIRTQALSCESPAFYRRASILCKILALFWSIAILCLPVIFFFTFVSDSGK